MNTTAHNVRHGYFSPDFSELRNTKAMKEAEGRIAFGQKRKKGLDYTPLFRFLLSKVGSKWDDVYSEAISRLDKPDPIWWMVDRGEFGNVGSARIGESSYYSRLFIDEQGLLQKIDPSLGPESVTPWCSCCTYTFNGHEVPKPVSKNL